MAIMDWVRRHKNKLLLSAGAVVVGYACYQAVKVYGRVIESKEIKLQTSLFQQAEQHAEYQLQNHFQNIQRISDTTTLPSILPSLKSQLFDQLDISTITERLAQGRESSREEKLELWQELKLLSFTGAACSMWALTLLVLFVRVQINILGRHIYLDTARDISTIDPRDVNLQDQRGVLSKSCQQEYIAFVEFFSNRGLDRLILAARSVVERTVGSKSLREVCSLADIQEIFECILRELESDEANWISYVLPPHNALAGDPATVSSAVGTVGFSTLSQDDEEKLELLRSETQFILESKEFKEVLTLSSSMVLNKAMEQLDAMYQERSTTTLHFAKIIPLVAKVGSSLLEQPWDAIETITSQQQLQTFCALVYSARQQ